MAHAVLGLGHEAGNPGPVQHGLCLGWDGPCRSSQCAGPTHFTSLPQPMPQSSIFLFPLSSFLFYSLSIFIYSFNFVLPIILSFIFIFIFLSFLISFFLLVSLFNLFFSFFSFSLETSLDLIYSIGTTLLLYKFFYFFWLDPFTYSL